MSSSSWSRPPLGTCVVQQQPSDSQIGIQGLTSVVLDHQQVGSEANERGSWPSAPRLCSAELGELSNQGPTSARRSASTPRAHRAHTTHARPSSWGIRKEPLEGYRVRQERVEWWWVRAERSHRGVAHIGRTGGRMLSAPAVG